MRLITTLPLLIAILVSPVPARATPGIDPQHTKLIPSDPAELDNFGSSVSVSGATLAVGAPQEGENPIQSLKGAVYVFVHQNGTWAEEAKLIASDRMVGDYFGSSVALKGDVLVVGAPGADVGSHENQGSVYVFVRISGTWVEQAKLTAADGAAGDEFGLRVALDGETVVVGARRARIDGKDGQGAAYVFVRAGSAWTQQAKLTASDGEANDFFGSSVAIAGFTVAVGAELDRVNGEASRGSVYVFVRGGTTWAQQARFSGSGSTIGSRFGVTVAIDMHTIVVGSMTRQAYVFSRLGPLWAERAVLEPAGPGADGFGVEVAVAGDLAVVGASFDSHDLAPGQGSVYAFRRVESVWSPGQRLTASDGTSSDNFGTAVALDDSFIVVGAPGDATPQTSAGSAYVFTVPPPLPQMALDKTSLRFTAVTSDAGVIAQTSAQRVRLTQSGGGIVTWTAESNQPWLTVSPISGTGSAELTVAIIASEGPPVRTSAEGAITLSLTGAGNAAGPIRVHLVNQPPDLIFPPLGRVETPMDNLTGVTGAVPFTGWAVDIVEIAGVTVCRAAVTGESAPIDNRCGGAAQIFIGDAVFIDGARPDVQFVYRAFPRSSEAGWGFMVLTNILPDVARALPAGGNGTFLFYIYARGVAGHVTLLGTRTLTCDNEHATRPFGTIDTPGQGEVVSGASYVNFGWALTPQPKFIPFDGSTIQVFVDGVAVGNVSYNHFREDIAGFFPGLANSDGAVAFRSIDTTELANGLHTIAWGVTDSAGSAEGLGSRYFTVSNGVAVASASGVSAFSRRGAGPPEGGHHSDMESLPLDRAAIRGRRGWDIDAPWRDYPVEATGRAIVHGEELDRFELQLAEGPGETYGGRLRVGNELATLPIGSHLDASTGRFTWSPGVGFVGTYDLVFVRSSGGHAVARQEVRIVLAPKGSGRLGPQVVIDTPGARPDAEQPFKLAGWAADLDADDGTGIDTLHVWAYPLGGAAPTFLGVADYGAARPDVAAVHGEQFRNSGYGLIVQGLAHGNYDLAVFAWSTVQGGFVPAQVVRVTVR